MGLDYILALDQGTTSSRAILFDRAGLPVASAQEEFNQIYPHPGWVEHDPDTIWETQLRTARHVLEEAEIEASQIAALGVANQRETILVWDRATGDPIYNAVVWQCRRSKPVCDRLRSEGLEPEIRAKTGLLLDPYFSATKIAWILEHVPHARQRADRGELACGTVDTFLLWRLTEGALHITDATNASRTLLFNIHTLAWDPDLLRIFDIPPSMLPRVVPSSGPYGQTSAQLLAGPVTIASMIGDQQAALFGQGCYAPGMVKSTYGTGCFILANTGNQPVASPSGLLTTVAWQLPDRFERPLSYCLEGSVFVAGAAVQWLRDGLGLIDSPAEVEALAAGVPDTDGVYFVPAFVGLGAPYWEPAARGVIVGLSRGSRSSHLARAALESIAFQARDVVDLMAREGGAAVEVLRVDGGASNNDFLLQFQADILGSRVQRSSIPETSALGAAYLAGLGVDFWSSVDALSDQWHMDKEFFPGMSDEERAARHDAWRRAVDCSLSWAHPERGR
jgi:glycerol kinase